MYCVIENVIAVYINREWKNCTEVEIASACKPLQL